MNKRYTFHMLSSLNTSPCATSSTCFQFDEIFSNCCNCNMIMSCIWHIFIMSQALRTCFLMCCRNDPGAWDKYVFIDTCLFWIMWSSSLIGRRPLHNYRSMFSDTMQHMLSWWRHQMETFSALLALCAGNSPGPVNSPHKGQWRGALMFSLICARINDWVNNREAGDLRRHRGHYDVNVMYSFRVYVCWLKNNFSSTRLSLGF